MNKTELISENNELITNFEKDHKSDIESIIKDSMKTKNLKIINSKDDLSGANGFYMIFCNKAKESLDCTCTLKKDDVDYICVYRGHSSNIKNRLESHLFFDENTKYPNCMKVIIESKKYNINNEIKKVYIDGKIDESVILPTWNWGVIHIPLTDSKQALREMFENVFDGLYKKPIFSDK